MLLFSFKHARLLRIRNYANVTLLSLPFDGSYYCIVHLSHCGAVGWSAGFDSDIFK